MHSCKQARLACFGISAAVLLSLVSISAQEQQKRAEWEDQTVNFINVEPVRSDTSVPSGKQMTLLNGNWKFNFVLKPEDRPMDFFKVDFDDSSWKTIPVPSTWQVQGYGTPLYTNVSYPFETRTPPLVTAEPPRWFTAFNERNPVGSFRRTFEIPSDFGKGGQVFLRFNGVEAGYWVWINGKQVGYAEDSYNPDEFNITKYLQSGKNTIAVQVFRWTDGSYLEDQDFFRHSGIFRDVVMFHTPDLSLRDIYVHTLLKNDYKDGTLEGNLFVKNYTDKALKGNVKYSLSYQGKTVWNGSQKVDVPAGEEIPVKLSCVVSNVNTWTAEEPNLYQFQATIDADNNSSDAHQVLTADLGFKTVEVGPQYQLLINGKETLLKGVNRHETHPDMGRAITKKIMERDIMMMKAHNVNALRTSHYPDDPYLYELCNKYGIYVIAESNIECHGKQGLTRDNTWTQAYVERNQNTVNRLKNNPCVTFWSVGNENGRGQNITAAANAIREIDNTRLIHSCDVSYQKGVTDMGSCMYPDVNGLNRIGSNTNEKAPFFVCEYAHSMGNALGNFQEYMDAFEKHPRLVGGCIWDWVDQDIHATYNPETKHYVAAPNKGTARAYGGMFGDNPNDNNFCENGVIDSERHVTPKLMEVKKVYQYLRFKQLESSDDTFKVQLTSKYFHSTLKGATIAAIPTAGYSKTAKRDVQSFAVPDLKPGESHVFSFKLPANAGKNMLVLVFPKESLAKYHVTDTSTDAFATVWNKTDDGDGLKALANGNIEAALEYSIAYDSFLEAFPSQPYKPAASSDKITLNASGENSATITGKNFTVSFKDGLLSGIVYDGKQMLLAPVTLNAYRAPVDNDGWLPIAKGRDQKLFDTVPSCTSFKATEQNGNVLINAEISYQGRHAFSVKTIWTIFADGTIRSQNTILPGFGRTAMPCLGFVMNLPQEYNKVDYLGYGPMENYCDRSTAAVFDKFSTTAQDMFTKSYYARSQACGNRFKTSWVKLTSASDSTGISFRSENSKNGMEFSALPWTQHEINSSVTPDKLAPSVKTVLELDAFQAPLGGNSCGPRPLDSYITYASNNDFFMMDFVISRKPF